MKRVQHSVNKMDNFNNKFLNQLNDSIPVGEHKLKQIFLFTLIDAYLSSEVTDDEFLDGIKSILTQE